MVAVCFALLLFTASPLEARPISVQSIGRMAQEADVIVVGRVTSISSAPANQSDEARWHLPLLQMTATVHVLRADEKPVAQTVPSNSDITVPYLAIDTKRGTEVVYSPTFPQIAVGDIDAFPLVKGTPPSTEPWKLIQEEDFGMLVPCVAEVPSLPPSRAEKLWAELAETMAHGTSNDVHKAAEYLRYASYGYNQDPDFGGFLTQLDDRIGKDENRWLQVGVAAYCESGVPRPAIADLPGQNPSALLLLAAHAFGRVEKKGIAPRIIKEAMAQLEMETWGVSALIRDNYPDDPLAIKLLEEALAAGNPQAISAARGQIRHKNDALVPAVTEASVKYLAASDPRNFDAFRDSVQIVVDYGNDKDFAVFLNELRKAQTSDSKRYNWLWASCQDSDSHRMPAVCRVMIDDQRPVWKDDRFCDRAVWALERAEKVKFGVVYDRNPDGTLKQSLADRDKVVTKARAWLDSYFSKSG